MRDPKQLVSNWINRKRSTAQASVPKESNPPPAGKKVASAVESLTDNISLALAIAEQVVHIAQVAPFIAPAAALLAEILKSYQMRFDREQCIVLIIPLYQEMKSSNEKRDTLAAHIADLTGDISASVLRMEATNHSDLILSQA